MKTDLRPVSEQAKDAVDGVISKILSFSEVSREHGLLAVIPLMDKQALEDRNNLFEYGLAMACDGFDAADIEDILQNIRELKNTDYTGKIVDALSIIGVLGIQQGLNPRILAQKLDSRVPEQCRSEGLKKRIAGISQDLVSEEGVPRAYLRPEEAADEFEKLAALTDTQIQLILREVDTETLAWAVRDNEKMKGVFCHNMSGQCAELTESAVQDVRERKTLAARKHIVAVAENLKFIRGRE